MRSCRARLECCAAVAVVVGALMLFWAPGGAGAVGEHHAVSHAALRAMAVGDHAIAPAPTAGATTAADDATHGADAISDGAGKLADGVGAAADRLLPGRDRDGGSSDRCSNDCPGQSDDGYDRASREQPAPDHQCDDACGGSSAGRCASADCPSPSSERCAKDCPSPSGDQYDRPSRERPAPGHNCADACRGSSAGGCASADCPPPSSGPGYGACPGRQEPADCRQPCGRCPGQEERPQPAPPPERNAPPRCVERPGCHCPATGSPPGPPPSGGEKSPGQPAPSSPPAKPGPPPAQPAPSSPTPSPAQPAPGAPSQGASPSPSGPATAPAPAPATPASSPGAASAGDHPALTASSPAPGLPITQVAGETITASPGHTPGALPRTGSHSRPVAGAGLGLIVAGLGLVAGGRLRPRNPGRA